MAAEQPSILVSYEYLNIEKFEKECSQWRYRSIIIDSGAFSAYNRGSSIDLSAFIDAAKRIKAIDPLRVDGVFALDVIGDWKASLKNTEKMWRAGIEAIPTFHKGEPWDVLIGLARDYPKIGLGGVAKSHMTVKQKWAEQCFARVWPKKIHGLGFGAHRFVLALPFHSVDATSWKTRTAGFGSWTTFGHLNLKVTNQISLQSEIRAYLATEHKARGKWRNAMKQAGATDTAPTVYLAAQWCKADKRDLGI